MPLALGQFCRVLLRLYPDTHRRQISHEFEAACLECVDRESRRLGVLGPPYAWLRIAADTVWTAAALRRQAARARRQLRIREAHISRKDTLMNRLLQDARYSMRLMRRTPAFSALIVLTLALAIGATTAVFSAVDAALLRSLPYRDPDRLVLLYQAIPGAIPIPIGFSPPDYLALRERTASFDGIAAFRNREYELSGVEPPERVMTARVSASLFDVLGVSPAAGATFSQADDDAGAPVAVISDGLWTRKFARDPAALGKAIMLDRRPYTVVAIMPRDFVFPLRGPLHNNVPADVYLPISYTAGERVAFGSMYNTSVVARMKPGLAVATVDADTRALVRGNAQALYPAVLRDLAGAITASGVSFRDEVVGRTKRVLLIAFGAVAFVLLIACADIAALMLTRAVSRQREIAVRVAVGAGRRRIIRQLLVEAGLLAVVGGALGILFAYWLSGVLGTMAPASMPGLADMRIDMRLLAFATAVTLVTALLCGLVPALEISRVGASDALKEGARSGTPARRQRRIFGALVTAQVAIAVVLLVGGGLLTRSLSRLMSVDPGFQPDRVVTLTTSLPVSGYRTAADVRTFYTRLLEQVQRLPGVSAAGASTDLPLNVRERRAFTIENESAATRSLPHAVANEWLLGQHLEALGVPLKRGRYFAPQDVANAELVAIVNERMARLYWGSADPVGQRIAWGGPADHGPWMRIVGVVGDVKQGALNTETVPQSYTPWLQVRDSMVAENVVGMMRSLRLTVRTAMEPTAIVSTLRQQVRALDPSLPVTALQTMNDVVRTSTATPRFTATLIGGFALLALLLAGIGIGGVLATSVSGRTQELGVRLALGAQPRTLLAMVLREGMLLASAGLAIGWLAAWLLSRVMSTLLYEIDPRDPLTFGTVGALLVGGALLASAVPAWRASRVDPLNALRREQ